MNCENFKNYIIDLFDREVDPELNKMCKDHMLECQECREYYNQIFETAEQLKPKHFPVIELASSTKVKRVENTNMRAIIKRIARRYYKIVATTAAVVAIIVLFTISPMLGTKAEAKAMQILTEVINNVNFIKSYTIELHVRTLPNENFAFFDPTLPPITLSVQYLKEGENPVWRVEKESGRVVMCDGENQYNWLSNGAGKGFVGPFEANFLEDFSFLVNPKNLFLMQKTAVERKDATIDLKTTDNENIVITTFSAMGDILPLAKDQLRDVYTVTIENLFSKNNNQLKKINAWIEFDDAKILIISTNSIHLNPALIAKTITSRPKDDELFWVGLADLHDISSYRLAELKRETATDAANRIMNAIISGDVDQAREALIYYDADALSKHYKGYQATSFTEPKRTLDYAGVYVFFDLTNRDGKIKTQHIALRNDNSDKIWILDGGL